MFAAPKSIWEKGPLMATHMGPFCSDNLKPPIKARHSAMLPKTPAVKHFLGEWEHQEKAATLRDVHHDIPIKLALLHLNHLVIDLGFIALVCNIINRLKIL